MPREVREDDVLICYPVSYFKRLVMSGQEVGSCAWVLLCYATCNNWYLPKEPAQEILEELGWTRERYLAARAYLLTTEICTFDQDETVC